MKEENWALPIMQTLILDLRSFARRADKRCSGKPGERQEKAALTMMTAFRVCVADNRAKADDTKKWGMLFVVNQLFKVRIIIGIRINYVVVTSSVWHHGTRYTVHVHYILDLFCSE